MVDGDEIGMGCQLGPGTWWEIILAGIMACFLACGIKVGKFM